MSWPPPGVTDSEMRWYKSTMTVPSGSKFSGPRDCQVTQASLISITYSHVAKSTVQEARHLDQPPGPCDARHRIAREYDGAVRDWYIPPFADAEPEDVATDLHQPLIVVVSGVENVALAPSQDTSGHDGPLGGPRTRQWEG